MVFAIVLLSMSFLAYIVYTFFTVKHRNGARAREFDSSTYPFVSILKPLKNMDDDIKSNLESLFLLDYPHFEILMGVDAIADPVVNVINELKEKYPNVPCKIIETGNNGIENPKVHKLVIMETAASGSLYWSSDSNVRAEKNTLKQLVAEYLINGSKLVFCPIRATGSRSIGSIIENAYINHFLSGNMIAAWAMAHEQIIVGKSILVEKEALDRFGGFSYFKDYLAEDYMMGETYTQSKIPISSNFTWITTVNRNTTIKGFFARMERWAKMRFRLRTGYYLLEILLNPVMIALVAWMVLGSTTGAAIFVGSFLLKLILEYINLFYVNDEDRQNPWVVLVFPLCLLLKDFLLLGVYFAPFFSSKVQWRGNKISIGKKTLIALSQESLLYKGA